jgi:hypothetical protein
VRVAAAELSHREILDNPLLRFVETVVSAVECFLDGLELDLLAPRAAVPGK